MSVLRWAALAFLLAIAPANAYTQTVKELYDDCTATETYRSTYCLGVVHGVGAVMQLIGEDPTARQSLPRQVMCSDQPVPTEAEVQAFKNWAIRNPALWSKPGAYGVILALSSTWPCR